ncbi:hypothetical protein [Pseudomonas phage PA69]|uniref:Uncharacterized protein n=1 Tax=Pseudomonas phage PA69 TaxID=3073017 RepID=A0AAX4G078_9CAUD|nr:hypothetical protein [Pseudomonas phage PA69]
MTQQLNALQAALALANKAAETATIDMSETSTGGGGGRIFPAGTAMGRFCIYIELGDHAKEFQGKLKNPAPQIRLGFALWGDVNPQAGNPQSRPDDLFHTYEADGSIKPGLFRTFEMTLGNNEKSKTKLAFDKMNWSGQHTHFAQMLGQAFIIPIKRTKITKGNNAGKERNDIDWGGIMKPYNPVDGSPYNVPELPLDLLQYFFFDAPTKETWDALFIEGTSDSGKSKNFLQETIRSATNFPGSALHIMLGGGDDLIIKPTTQAAGSNLPAVPNVAADAGVAAAPAVPAVPQAVAQTAPSVPQVANVAAPVVGTAEAQNVLPDVPQVAQTAAPAAVEVPAVPVVPAVPQV